MKFFLFVFLYISIFSVSKAQMQFGIKGGLNLSALAFSVNNSFGSPHTKLDFNAGLLASVPLLKDFCLQPELVYSAQGTKSNEGNAMMKLNYGYINVPVLFKYKHASGLFAETGPQIGFIVVARLIGNGPSGSILSSIRIPEFSWAFGFGYRIPASNLGIGVRYNMGLTNVYRDSEGGSVKNRVFQFGLFYLVGGK